MLNQSNGGLNSSRFIRLVALSFTEMCLSVPFSVWALANAVRERVPSQNWSDLHYGFSEVYVLDVDALARSPTVAAITNVNRWIPVFTAFLYFVFFGMQDDAISNYARAGLVVQGFFRRLASRLGRRKAQCVRVALWDVTLSFSSG